MQYLTELAAKFRQRAARYAERAQRNEGVVRGSLMASATDWTDAAEELEVAILRQENHDYMASVSSEFNPVSEQTI